jgi:hypothetical protein
MCALSLITVNTTDAIVSGPLTGLSLRAHQSLTECSYLRRPGKAVAVLTCVRGRCCQFVMGNVLSDVIVLG